jgi:hypothetical protein
MEEIDLMGRVGPTGPPGPQGPQGPPGPQGPAANSGFAFLCSTEDQTVAAASSAGGSDGGTVTFNNSLVRGTLISFSSPSSIVINESGFFSIRWKVFPTAGNNAFGLFFDPAGPASDSLVLCSNYGTGAGNQPYQGQVVTELTAGGVLQLKRIDQMGALTLQSAIGGGTPVVSASIVIVGEAVA